MIVNRTLPRRTLLASLAAAPFATLLGCGGSGSGGGNGTLRVVNASQGYSAVDLYMDGGLDASGVAYGTASSYQAATSGSHTVAVSQAGVATPLVSQSRAVTQDVPLTLVFYGTAGAVGLYAMNDNQPAAPAGQASLLIRHVAAGAGTVDVYLSGATDPITSATLLAQGLMENTTAAGNAFIPVSAGSYRLRVTAAGDTNTLLLDTGAANLITFTSTEVASLMLTGTPGGALVNGVLITQGGGVQSLANTQAMVRVVSALPSGSAVSGTVGSHTVASTSPSIGAYALVSAGSLQPSISVNNVAMNIAAQTLAAGSSATLLIWGSPAAPGYTWIDDDNRVPVVANDAKLRLLNGLTDSNAPTTLTANFSVVATNVAQGAASAYGLQSAIALTELGVSTTQGAVYETLQNLLPTLVAGGVYTLFLFGPVASPQVVLRRER